MQQKNNINTTPLEDSARTERKPRTDEVRQGVAEVAVPSNTATNKDINTMNGFKILRFGVDSLYLSYQGDLYPEVYFEILKLKERAQSEDLAEQARAQYLIRNHLFEVNDKGTGKFCFVLENNAYRIQLSKPNTQMPMAYVKISSEYLTHKLPKDIVFELTGLVQSIGVADSEPNVSRLDLFADFVSFYDMGAWQHDAWVTRAANISTHTCKGEFTGWSIGMKGPISARLYNKITEIITQSHKLYLIPLWAQAGRVDSDPVWRLEFEFKREFLRSKDLASFTQIMDHLNSLWSYGTTEWLRLTEPNYNDSKHDRWPIHPLWMALSSIDWETNDTPLKSRFSNQRTPEKKNILQRAFSSLTTWMALEGHMDYEEAILPFTDDLYHYINNTAMDKGSDFDRFIHEKVGVKAKSYNTMDVNAEIYEDYVNQEVSEYRKQSDGDF